MIDLIPEQVDSPVCTGLAGTNSSTNDTPPLVQQMASEDNHSMEEAVMADLGFCDAVVGGPTSTYLQNTGLLVDLAGDVTTSVSSPADLAGDVAVGVSSPANLAGSITFRVVLSVVAEVASSADIAEVVSSTDLAEVASSADLAEVASSADLAKVASSADLARDVTVSVTSSAIAEVASLVDIAEVASSADLAEVASSAEPARDITVGVTSLANPASIVTTGVAFHEECEVPSG